jgi:hypothetical protein
MSLNFEPGLTAQFRSLEDVCSNAVYRSRLGVDGVARELDMGASELTRRLSAHVQSKEGDVSNRPLRVADLVEIVKATGDHRPVYWLIESFLQDADAKRNQALEALASMAPAFLQLMSEAGIAVPKGKR